MRRDLVLNGDMRTEFFPVLPDEPDVERRREFGAQRKQRRALDPERYAAAELHQPGDRHPERGPRRRRPAQRFKDSAFIFAGQIVK